VARRSKDESLICWVDTEGFVLKAKIMSAKVMDYEGINSLLCGKRRSGLLASVTCGWTRATAERARAHTGYRRPWGGVWIS
jgi:hypothetical protein